MEFHSRCGREIVCIYCLFLLCIIFILSLEMHRVVSFKNVDAIRWDGKLYNLQQSPLDTCYVLTFSTLTVSRAT